MIRTTTVGNLKNFNYNLQRSSFTKVQAQNTVLTQRKFNSYAEDPATASKCFQLRRSLLRAESQLSINTSTSRKYDVAWATLDSVIADVDNTKNDSALAEIMYSLNDPTASGRNSLGESLGQIAEGIVLSMNCRYGDNFVFAGADGLNVPFEWGEAADGSRSLTYRGVPVDSYVPELGADGTNTEVGADGTAGGTGYYALADGGVISVEEYNTAVSNVAKLEYFMGEGKFVDLGLGLEEKPGTEQLIESSAFDSALQGITFLGYGVDEDGDPKNIISIIHRMGEILKSCDAESGEFPPGGRAELERLFHKFEDAADVLSQKHVEMDTRAEFLYSNQAQLENTQYTLQEQIVSIEDVDLADAITSYSWAQYCYNAALKVGNSILGQSLMDFLQF